MPTEPLGGLVLGGELLQAVVHVFFLVDNGCAGGVGVAGGLAEQAVVVVGIAEPADVAVDAGAQGADGVGGLPAQHVDRVLVDVAVLVGEAGFLALAVVALRLLGAGGGAGRAGAEVGQLGFGQQVVAVQVRRVPGTP